MNLTDRTPLEIGFTDLSIGRHSVGLAPSRTGEQVVEAYLELISLVRKDRPEYLRDEDINVLANETKLDPPFIMNRVRRHLSSPSVLA